MHGRRRNFTDFRAYGLPCMTDDKSTTKIGVNKATLFEDASV
jgi:hypothetical protein